MKTNNASGLPSFLSVAVGSLCLLASLATGSSSSLETRFATPWFTDLHRVDGIQAEELQPFDTTSETLLNFPRYPEPTGISGPPDAPVIEWSSEIGSAYKVWVSPDLFDWSSATRDLPASPTGVNTWTDEGLHDLGPPSEASRRFYRVEELAGYVQKGISYASWWPGEYSTPEADTSLANLASTGAEWIGLIVTWYQETIASTTMFRAEATPTDDDLVHVISEAHRLGLNVMLKPHIDLSDDPTHWRGQIGQSFTSKQWDTWFRSYRDFVEHYAELARIYGADQFCVGTELTATSHRDIDWRTVIQRIRALYHGPITYAANHGGEETRIAWWDAVDYIGVDAYYPLTSKNDPTTAELKAAWVPRVATLANLASTWGKPILFTEIGYRSVDGANRHPWEWGTAGTVDLQEQADCYQAVLESVFNQPWFAGIFCWVWSTNPSEGGPEDIGFTPHNKPAEDVLRLWYGATP